MILYYKEDSGDYLCIDTSTELYYTQLRQPQIREGRSTAIVGLASSMCTGGISLDFIKEHCVRVKKSDVPKEYLDRM